MRIVGRERLSQAEADHRGSGLVKALQAWVKVVEGARWRHFMDVRATWSGVDNVPPYVVFDLKGNQFRLTAAINYAAGTVLVMKVQTHKDYSRKGL
ncbi:MAG TPA: type II toxin-antitoxin system HigB family toxin [Candidatus Binatia bacterium]|nr:type II toxin-antitoxin system HigB family toxin [Candidatus Binatia bacterium]